MEGVWDSWHCIVGKQLNIQILTDRKFSKTTHVEWVYLYRAAVHGEETSARRCDNVSEKDAGTQVGTTASDALESGQVTVINVNVHQKYTIQRSILKRGSCGAHEKHTCIALYILHMPCSEQFSVKYRPSRGP